MFDWLFVGGGLHGSFVARHIADAASDARVAILDDHAALTAWQRRADACGMTYLRSSGAHHLGRRADALRRFAATRGFDDAHRLGYYRRPSRALFETHATAALTGPERIRARAARIERRSYGWRVHTLQGIYYDTTRLVLALGPNTPYRPAWATDCAHVYDRDFDAGYAPGQRTAVIGGGITGAQLALRLQALGHTVCWVTRDRPRPADFDSDPCYAGAKCLSPFARLSWPQRTLALANARLPGTLPPDIMARITAALAAGDIAWRCGEIGTADRKGLIFADGRRVEVDRIVLATGFEARPRPDSLLGRCIDQLGLATDVDGHILINRQLEAASGLHILGRPASLQLGPMAGNIKGARLAGQRLARLVV